MKKGKDNNPGLSTIAMVDSSPCVKNTTATESSTFPIPNHFGWEPSTPAPNSAFTPISCTNEKELDKRGKVVHMRKKTTAGFGDFVKAM